MPCCDENLDYTGRIKARYEGTSKGAITTIDETEGMRRRVSTPLVWGQIYELPARYANSDAYPQWKLVELLPGAKIPDSPVHVDKSEGLTEYIPGITRLNQRTIFGGMTKDALKTYIENNGGTVKTNWSKSELVEEALRLT